MSVFNNLRTTDSFCRSHKQGTIYFKKLKLLFFKISLLFFLLIEKVQTLLRTTFQQ
jgi:hypothetical protein